MQTIPGQRYAARSAGRLRARRSPRPVRAAARRSRRGLVTASADGRASARSRARPGRGRRRETTRGIFKPATGRCAASGYPSASATRSAPTAGCAAARARAWRSTTLCRSTRAATPTGSTGCRESAAPATRPRPRKRTDAGAFGRRASPRGPRRLRSEQVDEQHDDESDRDNCPSADVHGHFIPGATRTDASSHRGGSPMSPRDHGTRHVTRRKEHGFPRGHRGGVARSPPIDAEVDGIPAIEVSPRCRLSSLAGVTDTRAETLTRRRKRACTQRPGRSTP